MPDLPQAGYRVRHLKQGAAPVETAGPAGRRFETGETITEKKGVAFLSIRGGTVCVNQIIPVDYPYRQEKALPIRGGRAFLFHIYAQDGTLLFERPLCFESLSASDPSAQPEHEEPDSVVYIPLFPAAREMAFRNREGGLAGRYFFD